MPARLIALLCIGLAFALSPQTARGQLPIEQKQTEKKSEKEQSEEQKREEREDVVSLETNLVVVNVTVTDAAERYVSGLTARDFRLFEDGAPQKITSFRASEMPFAAVIIVDTSGSMEMKMTLARAACARFVEGIREGDVVSIYTFGGTKVTRLQDFSEVRDVADSLWDTRADGMTPLYDAIVTAADALAERPERRRAILIISDGADTQSRASFDEALRRSLAADVAVYAVDLSETALGRGPGRSSGAGVMRELAAKTGGRFFSTPGGGELRDAFTQTVEELRNQYTITYEPSNDKQDGKWRAIQVQLRKPQLNVRARQGYYAARSR